VKLYEAMFLVDSSQAASDWEGIEAKIRNILEKSQAEIVSMKKWDERRLAYKINKQSRGTYILSFFRADGARIRDIERDVQLSEKIMRVLILSAEGREHDIEKDTPATAAEKKERQTKQEAEKKAEPEPARVGEGPDTGPQAAEAESAGTPTETSAQPGGGEPPEAAPAETDSLQPQEPQTGSEQMKDATHQETERENVAE